jgi:hypothetical protein
MNKPSKGKIVFAALAWATIISIVLYFFGVRQTWIFALVYGILTFPAIFSNNFKDHF